jgi:hypothetical protein
MSMLTHCTLTGVDEKTDLADVSVMSGEHPIVEWGFLYSPKRQGQPGRYPSVGFLREAFQSLPDHVRVAVHVCGTGVPQLIEGDGVARELVHLIAQRGGRVQLNFNAFVLEPDFHQLELCMQGFPAAQFITQYNESNYHVWRELRGADNHSVLFDASGGRGVEPLKWESPLSGVTCGYAGGLGPTNVATKLEAIQASVGNRPFWIDMEGKLRDRNDWFDLKACEAVLRALFACGLTGNADKDLPLVA